MSEATLCVCVHREADLDCSLALSLSIVPARTPLIDDNTAQLESIAAINATTSSVMQEVSCTEASLTSALYAALVCIHVDIVMHACSLPGERSHGPACLITPYDLRS